MDNVVYIDKSALAKFFPPLPDRVNKGQMGRVLCVCGSYDGRGLSMCGAAYFAAMAAYRSGAGIVEIFTPRKNYEALASLVPEAVFSLYEYDEDENEVCERLVSSLNKADSAVVGCGLGKSKLSRALVRESLKNADIPMLIDADALNIISEEASLWSLLSDEQRRRTVITPHPGEMARLCAKSVAEILCDVPGVAASFAREKKIVCLLKDHNTAISDGERCYINTTGNCGMATGGMGDILAGIIGAILARVKSENEIAEAVAAGCRLHGRAGDIAADKSGAYSLVASDLLAQIGAAVKEVFGQF